MFNKPKLPEDLKSSWVNACERLIVLYSLNVLIVDGKDDKDNDEDNCLIPAYAQLFTKPFQQKDIKQQLFDSAINHWKRSDGRDKTPYPFNYQSLDIGSPPHGSLLPTFTIKSPTLIGCVLSYSRSN